MQNYRKPSLLKEAAILCFTLVSFLVLLHVKPEQGTLSAMTSVLLFVHAVVAMHSLVSIIQIKKLRAHYIQQKMRRAEPEIITDELLQLLDTLDLDEDLVQYGIGYQGKHLAIAKYHQYYLCRLTTEEFGSYDIATSSEIRIKESWTYTIPRKSKSDVARLVHERLETTSKPAVSQDDTWHTALEFLHYLFNREDGKEAEATPADLHQLYQHVRYTTAT